MVSPTPSIESRVLSVLRRVSRDPINPTRESELVADLGFDSLRLLELIAELEDEFDIYIPLNEVPAIRTVGEAIDRVAGVAGGRAAS